MFAAEGDELGEESECMVEEVGIAAEGKASGEMVVSTLIEEEWNGVNGDVGCN